MLRKRGKYWYVIYYNEAKKQVWVSTKLTDELDAKQFELDFLKAIREKNESGRLAAFVEKAAEQKVEIKGMPLADAWPLFSREFCRDSSRNITEKKRRALKNFFEWILKKYAGIEFVHEITYNMAAAYSQHLTASGISNHTHNIYVGYLKQIFKKIMFPAGMQANPWDYVDPLAASSVSYRPLKDNEIAVLLAAANPDWETAVLLGLYTGFDFANTRYCKWSYIQSVDVDGREIQVIVNERNKTGASQQIPVHPALAAHLKRYREHGQNGRNGLNGQREYILPGIFQTRGIEEQFPALLKTCGIKADETGIVGYHCLRHTFNSKLDEQGVETGTRQRLTGHASVNMNLVYTHSIKPLAAAIGKMPKWNPKKKPAKKNI